MAESIIGLYKTEKIWPNGPWRNLDEVEYATLEWVDWYNNKGLLEPIGNIPPIGFEADYYKQENGQAMAAWLTQKSLRYTRGGSPASAGESMMAVTIRQILSLIKPSVRSSRYYFI